MFLWIGFIVCTTVIIYAGTRLSKYGDIIAEKTGLSRTWIGVVLMASVTSLPELVTGISSVTYAGVPDIAIGDILGSCVFNMLIIVFLDAAYRPMAVSAKAHPGNVLSASFGILLLSIVTLSIFLGNKIYLLGWFGLYTPLLIGIYFIAMKLVYSYEKKHISEFVEKRAVELKYAGISLKTAIQNYCINAVLIIIAASVLPKIGEGIARITGLGQTFVGNIFIAVATSLPEVVVSVTAVRIGAVDLAIGNLFGSNIFNILILALDDLLFFNGPILSFVRQNHMVSALSAIAMTTTAIIGLTYRAEKKRLLLAWDSIGIVILYLSNLVLLYMLK